LQSYHHQGPVIREGKQKAMVGFERPSKGRDAAKIILNK
jgi:hypothetical protein